MAVPESYLAIPDDQAERAMELLEAAGISIADMFHLPIERKEKESNVDFDIFKSNVRNVYYDIFRKNSEEDFFRFWEEIRTMWATQGIFFHLGEKISQSKAEFLLSQMEIMIDPAKTAIITKAINTSFAR